jgi:hypothetical protein
VSLGKSAATAEEDKELAFSSWHDFGDLKCLMYRFGLNISIKPQRNGIVKWILSPRGPSEKIKSYDKPPGEGLSVI